MALSRFPSSAFAFLLATPLISLASCTNSRITEEEADASRTVEELMSPATCEECHENHVAEWSSSMHAYATNDPVFRAMNRRGQEETKGMLGDFCISCHAPLAVALGKTTDGLNMDEVEPELHGVTCYFCHNVTSVKAEHDNLLKLPANNPLELAWDDVMRGGLTDAVKPPAHGVAYSPLHDGDDPATSSQLCGPCHDIVTPKGVHLERTFAEWQSGIQADSTSCVGCHMDSYTGVAANTDTVQVNLRQSGLHRHLMPGVDTALTDFPGKDVQLKAIQCALRNAVLVTINMRPDRTAEIWMETDVGHNWPTGATQDRRAWLEVHAYDAQDNELFSVGDIADDQPVPTREESKTLVQMRDWIYKADGQPAHMFWDVASSDSFPKGYDSNTLLTRTKGGPPHTLEIPFNFPAATAKVSAQVNIRAIGHDLIDDLMGTGHLTAQEGAALKAEIRTHTLASSLTVWREADGYGSVTRSEPNDLSCPDDFLCLLEPTGPGCSD